MPNQIIAGLCGFLRLLLCASAKWRSHVDHLKGECVASSPGLQIHHPQRRMRWQVEILPGRLWRKGDKTLSDHDNTYEWAVTSLYDCDLSEWVRLPSGFNVKIDSEGFIKAWKHCLDEIGKWYTAPGTRTPAIRQIGRGSEPRKGFRTGRGMQPF